MDTSDKSFKGNASDHLANERTFLAWIRTGVGIMGFGFVVVKFSLFVRQIGLAIGAHLPLPQTGYSHAIGVILVALGGITIGLSYVRYLQTKKQLDVGAYYHSTTIAKIITTLIILVCAALMAYLIKTK